MIRMYFDLSSGDIVRAWMLYGNYKKMSVEKEAEQNGIENYGCLEWPDGEADIETDFNNANYIFIAKNDEQVGDVIATDDGSKRIISVRNATTTNYENVRLAFAVHQGTKSTEYENLYAYYQATKEDIEE